MKEHYKIPISEPYVEEEDVEIVAKAVREKRLSQGLYVEKFEKEFAEYIGVKHAVAVSNGTAALHTSLAAVGVGVGDEVIVPSFTFISTANCALFQGAKPIFVDIDPLTYNIDPSKIEEEITEKTKAVIPVHYAGQSADMDAICEVAEKHGMHVIEDAAEAHGSLYKGRKVGSLGELACFSFYPNKNMTTGEGGIITTDDDKLAEMMRMIRSHGQDRRYHHVILGYNYRMTDIQAALGLVQLRRMDWVIEKKVKAAAYYTSFLNENIWEVKPPCVAPYNTHTYMFYTVRFENEGKRNIAIKKLGEKGVDTRVAFPPVHLQPLYREMFGYCKGLLPITEEAGENVLSLPIYSTITQREQDYVLSILRSV